MIDATVVRSLPGHQVLTTDGTGFTRPSRLGIHGVASSRHVGDADQGDYGARLDALVAATGMTI
jgi:hypothetical protein